MNLDLRLLIDKSPRELSEIKKGLLQDRMFEKAGIVQEYISHCIATSRLIKKIIKG